MTMASLQLPEDPQQLAQWLEEQILSVDIGSLALQWELLAGEDNRPVKETFAQMIGPYLAEIDQRGLGVLPEDTLWKLLTHPEALLTLQEHILSGESGYWQDRMCSQLASPDEDAHYWKNVEAELTQPPPEVTPNHAPARPKAKAWWRGGALLALAASVALLVWFSQPVAQPGWGFNRPGMLETAQSEDELLETLANAAQAWFNKTPQNREELIARLQQFDKGCQKLLDAELTVLSPDTRSAVAQACQNTRDEIARHIAALQDEASFKPTQEAADVTVRKLEQEFRRLQSTS